MIPDVVVRIDRVQMTSDAPHGHKPPELDGFVITRDSFVRRQTTTSTYAKCRHYNSVTDDTKIYWQYSRRKGWLKPWKITIVADDHTGLSRDEIERVLDHCRFYRFLIVEVALDFGPQSGVNREFVKNHTLFGKSRRRAYTKRNSSTQMLYYGSRKSDKFVRCYWKPGLGFRVELELHSSLLRGHDISTLDDLPDLPHVIYPAHFRLVGLDWVRLKRYLIDKFGARGHQILFRAQGRARSIRSALRNLRTNRVLNPHRFLVKLPENEKVLRALNRWARHFRKGSLWINTK